jgi:hypothetical protein
MEIDIPNHVVFHLEVPQSVNDKLIGQKADYHFTLCFFHAVKAVALEFKIETSLEEYSRSCDVCYGDMFSRRKEGLPELLC